MSCLGVHFALTQDDAMALEAIENDDDRLEHLTEEIEERYFKEAEACIAESDKSWDAMHRALSDGTLSSSGGAYPLNHVVLGGTSLYAGDDYIMSLKTPAQVRDIAAALAPIGEAEFRRLYNNIDAEDYDGDVSDDDFEYTWGWFVGVRELYAKASAEGRFVLFTADQ
ncbi:YfbM family protein [Variovorax sp. ZS18.2.2]|uniref:YfbM family protein n=1 Tax=Variovorax sp. ZS18.2.2 TaxID=2971255 RepID=UPI0021519091|nr:YfbM family protein [Variovorax sp. ZS18.2.2]MCR6474650.1 YfbM family protein [Variovorax sp. ZS18.2.2]